MDTASLPILETERFRLRPLAPHDEELAYALDSDPEAMRFIAPPRTRAESRERFQRVMAFAADHHQLGRWVVEQRKDQQTLGWACLIPLSETGEIEVGYRFFPSAWGRGVATEVCRRLVDYAFAEVKLESVLGITHPDNLASQRVLEKSGLSPDGKGIYYGVRCLRFLVQRTAWLAAQES